jgi:hypothetical protein
MWARAVARCGSGCGSAATVLKTAAPRLPGSHQLSRAVNLHARDCRVDVHLCQEPYIAVLAVQQRKVLRRPLALQVPGSDTHADDRGR